MTTIKQEIERRVMALIETDLLGPFDPDALGDVLLIELERVWHDIPTSTRAVLAGVGVELQRHHDNGAIADMTAAEVFNRLRGQS